MNIEAIKTQLGYILGEMDLAMRTGSSDAKENVSSVLFEMHVIEEIMRVQHSITYNDVEKHRRAS